MVIRNAPGLCAVHKYGAALKRKLPFMGPTEGFRGYLRMFEET